MKSVQKISETTQDRILEMDLSAELKHGTVVSNLAYDVAKELGLGEKECYQLAIAGMLHDIGKLKLEGYINGQEQNPMVIEELKYVRMHSTLGYEILKDQGYSDYVLESILYHHENFDGSGYPSNRSGKDIPMGARILRVCDVYAALSMDRPYRKALEKDEVLRLMIDEIKNFDMQVFLAFQRVIHKGGNYGIKKETGYRNDGELTVRREVVSVSLCSVMSVSWVSRPILPRSSLYLQQQHFLENWISITLLSVSMTEES